MPKAKNQGTGDENARKSVNAIGPTSPSPSFGSSGSNGCYLDPVDSDPNYSLAQSQLMARSAGMAVVEAMREYED